MQRSRALATLAAIATKATSQPPPESCMLSIPALVGLLPPHIFSVLAASLWACTQKGATSTGHLSATLSTMEALTSILRCFLTSRAVKPAVGGRYCTAAPNITKAGAFTRTFCTRIRTVELSARADKALKAKIPQRLYQVLTRYSSRENTDRISNTVFDLAVEALGLLARMSQSAAHSVRTSRAISFVIDNVVKRRSLPPQWQTQNRQPVSASVALQYPCTDCPRPPIQCLAFELLQVLCIQSRASALMVVKTGALEYMQWYLTIAGTSKNTEIRANSPSLLLLQVCALRTWAACILYGISSGIDKLIGILLDLWRQSRYHHYLAVELHSLFVAIILQEHHTPLPLCWLELAVVDIVRFTCNPSESLALRTATAAMNCIAWSVSFSCSEKNVR